jgi:hypothetical protein
MPTGNHNHVPLSEAITEAKWLLGISETTIHDIELNTLAQRALIRMNNLNSIYIENVTLDVASGEAELPDNLLRIIAMRYCNANGVSYGAYAADFAFMGQCGCGLEGGTASTDLSSTIMINNGKIMWRYAELAPDKIKVSYRARKLDEDGFIMIYDYVVEAVKFFLCYQFSQKYMDRYLPAQYSEWKTSWRSQSERVISYDAFNSWQNNFSRAVSLSHPKIITL